MLKDKDLDKLFKSKFEGTSFEPDASSMEAAERMVEMTSSGELDQLFRDKFAAVNPAPPAESIAQMEKLLAGKKGFAWGRLGIAAGVILLFLSAGLWYFAQPDALKQSTPDQEYAVPESNSETKETEQPFENSSASDNVAVEDVPAENARQIESNANDASLPEVEREPKSEGSDDGATTVSNANRAAVANATQAGSEEQTTDAEQTVPTEQPMEVYASEEGSEEHVEENENPIVGNNGDVPPAEIMGSDDNESEENPSGENAQPIASTETENESVSESVEEGEVITENGEMESSNPTASNTPDESNDESVSGNSQDDEDAEELNADGENNTAKRSATSAKSPGFDNRRGYNNYFGLIAGLSVAPSFDAVNGKNPVSTNVVLGLRYAYQIRPELTLNVNALYSDRTGINQTKAVHDTIYHFGMATRSHYITPTRLHYVEMPIYISWQMDRNHSLSLGVSPAVLIGQNNRLDLVSQDSFDNMDYQTETHTGRSEGILHYDASLIMGYTYRVNEYWSVGVRGQYGLFDVTNNEYYHSPKTHRNVFIRFMAEYKLPF
jgi:hypothetical protein